MKSAINPYRNILLSIIEQGKLAHGVKYLFLTICLSLMKHFTTPDFWELYNALPKEVRELADKNFGLLQANPAHPSLHFKSVKDDVWSVRVGRNYRALAFEHEKGYDWFWIGPHAEYNHLLTHL